MTRTIALLGLLALAGCKKDQPTQPSSGGEVKATPGGEVTSTTAGTPSPSTGAETSKEAPARNPFQALAQLAKAGEALSKASQSQLGPVVNWRQLQPFVPAKLGELEGQGEIDGSTGGMGEMKFSNVKREYKAGDQVLRLEITDTSMVPMLRAGFAIAAQVNEDSTRGLKKGVTVEGQPGLLEWSKTGQTSNLALLVGGRYVVSLKLGPTEDPEAAIPFAKQLDLKGLAVLKAKE